MTARSDMLGLTEAFANTCERWSLGPADRAKLLGMDGKGDSVKVRAAYVIGVGLGLDALFQDAEAERHWLDTERSELGGTSPLDSMLSGRFDEVVELLNAARGLK